jgi:hypothetical protein
MVICKQSRTAQGAQRTAQAFADSTLDQGSPRADYDRGDAREFLPTKRDEVLLAHVELASVSIG